MDGFHVKPEAFTFEFLPGADSGFHVTPEAFAFNLTADTHSTPTENNFKIKPEAYAVIGGGSSGFQIKPEAYAVIGGGSSGFQIKPEAYAVIGGGSSGFQIKPEAYAVIGSPKEDSDEEGFHVKPEAFAFEFLVGAGNGFHVKPEAFAFEFLAGTDNGFHVKPAAFAFEFLVGADNGFHVKPEAFAFELTTVKTQLVLRLAIRHKGANVILPFTTNVSAPAVVIRWEGRNWYNPLVSPTNFNASNIFTTFDGKTFAFST